MFKVILLAALVSASWTKGYSTITYENDNEDELGLINADDLRPQYGRPIYQTQVEYNDEDEQDLIMEDEPIMYEQKSVEPFPKSPSGSGGYHKPGGSHGTYKGSDISQEIKHKKQTYETMKVSQEHVEVKSVSNEYGNRLPNSGKKEAPKPYKPSSPAASKESYKKPYDMMDYSEHIGQSNKEPASEYKHTYEPQMKKEAPKAVHQDNVEVDFKSQNTPYKTGSEMTGYQTPIQQTSIETGMHPGHYGHQGSVYMGHSIYMRKHPYEVKPNNPPPQTYGIYREGYKSNSRHPSTSIDYGKSHATSSHGGESGSSYHNSLGGSGVEYPGIGGNGRNSHPAPSTGHGAAYKGYKNDPHHTHNSKKGYGHDNIGNSYHQTSRGSGYNSGIHGGRSSGNSHNYGGGSRHSYSRPQSTYSNIGHANRGSYSNHGSHGNTKSSLSSGTRHLGGYSSQKNSGYHGHQGSSHNHSPYHTKSIKPHGIKHPYSGGSGAPIGSSHSGIKTAPKYHGSQPSLSPVGKAAGKPSSSSGSYHPKPNYPSTKISQEKHSDDYPAGGSHHSKGSNPHPKISQEKHSDDYPAGGSYHSKGSYPHPKISQEKHSDDYPAGGSYHSKGSYPQPKISQDKHSDDYPSITELKPQVGGIGESGYIGKGESPSSYPKGHPVAAKPKYPVPHHSSGVKGASYDHKEPKEYSEIKSAKPSYPSPSSGSGSSYKPPISPKGHSIKGGPKGGHSAEYESKNSQNKYLPVTAVAGGSSPSYKPLSESSSKYEPPKVEQKELSYESLLGGHGSQSPGSGTGGYGFTSNGSPSSGSSSSGYGSNEEPSKPMPYEFKYEVKDDEHGANQYREEKMDDDGYLTGRYGYKDAHGLFREVEYQASKDGFKVSSIKTNEPGTDNQDPADVHFEVEKNGQPQY